MWKYKSKASLRKNLYKQDLMQQLNHTTSTLNSELVTKEHKLDEARWEMERLLEEMTGQGLGVVETKVGGQYALEIWQCCLQLLSLNVGIYKAHVPQLPSHYQQRFRIFSE